MTGTWGIVLAAGRGERFGEPKQFVSVGGDMLVEDCSIRYYRNNLDIEGVHSTVNNITIRRCNVSDAWSNTSCIIFRIGNSFTFNVIGVSFATPAASSTFQFTTIFAPDTSRR